MTKYNPSDIHFLGIGAAKSGTTWLFAALQQHPDVYMPDAKELHYFNRYYWHRPNIENYRFDKPFSWYLSFFEAARPEQVKGEICPVYLFDELAPQKIHSFNSNIKLFAIIRNPVERAFSQYLFDIQTGELDGKTSFLDAIKTNKEILYPGLYFEQLQRFYALFPAGNILVMLFDDLKTNNTLLLKQTQQFIGVREYIPENIDEAVNISMEPRFEMLNRLYTWGKYRARKYSLTWLLDLLNKIGIADTLNSLRNRNVRPVAKKRILEPAIAQELKPFFRSDIEKLEGLLSRDLSVWK